MPYKDKKKATEMHRLYYLSHDGKNRTRRKIGVHKSKEDIAKYKRDYYFKHIKEIREYKNAWMKKWRLNKDNRTKENKRQLGRLKRKSFCEICSSKDKLQFHHWNYNKNIGSTLCRECHSIQHMNNKGGSYGF